MASRKPETTASAMIMTATLRAVAKMASLIMKVEKAPFCLTRYLRAMKKGKFTGTKVGDLVFNEGWT